MIRYSIKDLEKLTGVKAHTIRIWEKRYNMVNPARTATNIRYYSDQDFKTLMNVAILNKYGFKISSIVAMSEKEKNLRVMEITQSDNDFSSSVEGLIIAMIEFDEDRFEKIITSAIAKTGFDTTITKILYPFLEKVGILWLTGTIFPAQEHFVSNLIRQKLISAIEAVPENLKPNSKTFMLFLPKNEYHEIGLLYFQFLIKKYGHKCIYLGQNMPLTDLEDVVKLKKPDHILTAITTPLTTLKLREYIQQLSQKFAANSILLTGLQVREKYVELPANMMLLETAPDFISFLEGE